jgi:hypothetical protein
MRNSFKILCLSFLVLAIGLAISCKKQAGGTLGAKPTADFVVIPGSNPNNVTLVNKSNSPSIPSWRINNASNAQLLYGDSAKTSFIFAGTYPVTLYAVGQGGIDSITKSVVIAQSDPTACVGTQLGFITSCTSKKWKLDPAAAAYKVGPGPNDGSWWSNNAGDVAARYCEFNDEYTFSFNANQTFVYDNKGDFFGDGYMGNNTGTCQPTANYTPTQMPWASGNFKYSFTPNTGVNHLGQLTVIGLGAHIGLQKVRNGGEVQSPASSVTYDVLAETVGAPGAGDVLTLGVDIGGGGWWTFRLRSY